MQTWQWKTEQGLSYLTCRLLERWPHGFFTQQFWPRSPADLTDLLQPNAQLYRAKQVHGNTVLSTANLVPVARDSEHATAQEQQEPLEPADGLFAEQAEQAVWVCSADCTPVLIADVQTGQAAAVHAGWRGTAARIVPQTIAQFKNRGSQLSDLRVAMGPAIAGEVYQVSTEVAATVAASVMPIQFADTSQPSPSATAAAVLARFAQLPQPPVLEDAEPERLRLDVRRVNAMQLELLGLTSTQIAIAPYCTYQDPKRFFSYRRDGLKKVQWSGIVSL